MFPRVRGVATNVRHLGYSVAGLDRLDESRVTVVAARNDLAAGRYRVP